ncbi:hypothetical protein FKM82_017551 [Ascaphus truei]
MSGTVSMQACVGVLLGAGVLVAAGEVRWSGKMLSSCLSRLVCVVSWRGLDGVVMSSSSTAYMNTHSSDGGGALGDRRLKFSSIPSMPPSCFCVRHTGAGTQSKLCIPAMSVSIFSICLSIFSIR